ncbi:MAG: DNA methylase [Paludibacteraceae bacterium]|nr:DNA methylase [Paludibacteraceae bacterium]
MEKENNKAYIAIDLKSFYASVECVKRGLDPLNTHLVVADTSRTEKTICLAVSPSLKSYGIGGRCRLFELTQRLRTVNEERGRRAPGGILTGKSYDAKALEDNPSLSVDYIAAMPHMADYIDCSAKIYEIYLDFVSPEDIHVYSIDEVFIDASSYLDLYAVTPRELASRMIKEVETKTGITATAGVGTNLYLCKVAMDILAKHTQPDEHGVRVAELDEYTYRERLWGHRPLTDFWRIGQGIEQRLRMYGIETMGQLARFSLHAEDMLFKEFGVNAEFLIDHAWGWEPCTIAAIKKYKPSVQSKSSGQVLHQPYAVKDARTVLMEMVDEMSLDLVDSGLETDQVVLTVGYESVRDAGEAGSASVVRDRYGRLVPVSAHGSVNLGTKTNSSNKMRKAVEELYYRIVNPQLLVRRLTLVVNHLTRVGGRVGDTAVQLDLFSGGGAEEALKERKALDKERKIQDVTLQIKKRYGKNALLKGLDFDEKATARDRNGQIGGHKA